MEHVDAVMLALESGTRIQRALINLVCKGLGRALTPAAVQYLLVRHRDAFMRTFSKGMTGDSLFSKI